MFANRSFFNSPKLNAMRESVWFVVVWCAPYGFTNSNIESGSSTSFGASHKYDAWGTVTETVLGSSTNAANFQYGYIFGYRGYQYDKETGLYYCQSRYYNSRIGRFLSADDPDVLSLLIGNIHGANLYIYCNNNPVNDKDPTGELSVKTVLEWIQKAINQAINNIKDYINNLFKIDKKNKTIVISTDVISTAIDIIIAGAVAKSAKKLLETGFKSLTDKMAKKNQLTKIEKAVKTASEVMYKFLSSPQYRQVVIIVIKIALVKVGVTTSTITKITNTLLAGIVTSIFSGHAKILDKAIVLFSAFSSIGGIIAFAIGAIDKNIWDGRLTIKYG